MSHDPLTVDEARALIDLAPRPRDRKAVGIPLFPRKLYRVKSTVPGWRGWRLWYYALQRYSCECEDCPERWRVFIASRPLGLPRVAA